ncbi:restriction endonuclease [Bacillus sp. Bva_UNVM-123]|uniref:restriction endonuclease n=1 Tax=Bacillus sp. Bva_UNVM-123 TaxID=2829798 RepID=UPI00391FAF1E
MKPSEKRVISNGIGLFVAMIIIMYQTHIKELVPFLNNIYILIGFTIVVGLFTSRVIERLLPDSKTAKKTTPKKNNTTTNKTTKNKSSSQNKKLTDIDLLNSDIDSLSGESFERLVYLYFKDKGFKSETTPKSGDHGVDLVITDPKDGHKIAVQCKRYKSTAAIGNSDLIKLEGGKNFYRCHGTLFITTSSYTQKAKEFSESTKMEIWNRLHVFDKIDKWRKEKVKKIS